MAVAGGEDEGGGLTLLLVKDLACCSWQRQDCCHEGEFLMLL